MDITLIQGTLSGIKIAFDIANGLTKLKTISEIQGKVIELQSAILSAQSSALSANADQAAMVEEIRGLKEEITRVKAWETEKQRYKLHAPWEGAVVYALKQTMSNSEPPHWICTRCYENGKKSILNQLKGKDGCYLLTCPACNSQIQYPWRDYIPLEYAIE